VADTGSLYRTLGLSSAASAVEIKQAYHRRAKQAHPDAGGSAAAMAAVNEAYQILSDPEARRAYDEAEAPPAAVSKPTAVHHPQSTHYAEAARRAEAAAIERGRIVWARRSAWELLRLSAPLALAAIIATRLAAGHIASASTVLLLNAAGFIPVYLFILGIIFLLDPALRLIFADLARRYTTTKSEQFIALGLIVSYVPLAGLWAWLI
jgi:curved DNA-binding protein CbpA